jgi:hypothetical protein
VRNPVAFLALFVALLALAAVAGSGYVAHTRDEVSWLEAAYGIPVVVVLGLVALALANRAQGRHQRTLGRSGGRMLAGLARVLAAVALLCAAAAVVALLVFAVLVRTDGLTKAPW